MNIDLVVGGFFVVLTLVQSFLLLKRVSTLKKSKDNRFIDLLFKYISNSSIYVATLLIFTATFQQSINGIYNLEDLLDLILGIPIIAVMAIIILITVLILFIALIKGIFQNEEKIKTKLVNQQKARDIT